MSKLPLGLSNTHIQKSHGADTNIMKFYVTQNSTTYGARFDKFEPQKGCHKGTGYLSNFRPGVYYNRRLDDVDNPAMRRICDGNYRSVTQLDFQPYRDPSGLETFPTNVSYVPSGFIREKAITIPFDRQGPRYMKTEAQEKYTGHPLPTVDISTKNVGPQQASGYVRNISDEPITFEPQIAHGNLKPGWYTHRPMCASITKTSYIPTMWSRGDDALPGGISHGSERGTGFTRDEISPKFVSIKASDKFDRFHETPYLTHKQDSAENDPSNNGSVQHEQFKGLTQPIPTEIDRLNHTCVGFKEDTGYVRNNAPYLEAPSDKMRFLTNYMTRFGTDPNSVGVDRAGHLRGGIQKNKLDIFSKSTAVSDFGRDACSREVLQKIEPYVGRSLKARNVFFDDHTHDSKLAA